MATTLQQIAQHGLAMTTGYHSLSYTDAITAHAGGGQGLAVAMTTQINTVTTVASAGDSVVLPSTMQVNQWADGPTSNLGGWVVVINAGANTLAVFPDSGSTINGGAANASVNLASGDVGLFWQTSAGAWRTADTTNKIFNAVTLLGYLFESAASGITAGTTRTQAGATVLAKEVNRVDTSTAPAAGSYLGDGVVLPPAVAGLTILVWNNSANPVQLYGAGADTVNGVAAATGIAIPPNSMYLAVSAAPGSWMVDGTAMGNAGAFATESAINGLTAHAGGGQGAATALPAMMNRITTVATAADSVVLPASATGMQIVVVNAAAVNSMNVFPATGDAINALGANTAFAVAAGKTATFFCFNAGQWHSLLSA